MIEHYEPARETLKLLSSFLKRRDDNAAIVWDIITALRSCDQTANHDELKNLTTTRIRYVVGIPPGIGAVVRAEPLSIAERAVRDELLNSAPVHFQSHWRTAVYAIRILHDYDLQEEKVWSTAYGADR
jgi:hypothetical protein